MSQTLRRALTIDPASYDAEARTIELCYATTAPVDRYDYTEVLAISDDAIDTTRRTRALSISFAIICPTATRSG